MTTLDKNNFFELYYHETKNRIYLIIKGAWHKKDTAEKLFFQIQNLLTLVRSKFSMIVDISELTNLNEDIIQTILKSQRLIVQAGLSSVVQIFPQSLSSSYLIFNNAPRARSYIAKSKTISEADRILDEFSKRNENSVFEIVSLLDENLDDD